MYYVGYYTHFGLNLEWTLLQTHRRHSFPGHYLPGVCVNTPFGCIALVHQVTGVWLDKGPHLHLLFILPTSG